MAIVLGRKPGGSGGGGAPSGPAGGDLAGTYPNPTLAAGVGDGGPGNGGAYRNLMLSANSPFDHLSNNSFAANSRTMANRVSAGISGVIDEFWVLIASQGGNVDFGIYDTNSPRALLWSTGSIACPAPGWQSIGNPGLEVEAGDQFDLAVAASLQTASFGNAGTVANNVLPAAFSQGTGVFRRIWEKNTGPPLPATVAEADFQGDARLYLWICHISES